MAGGKKNDAKKIEVPEVDPVAVNQIADKIKAYLEGNAAASDDKNKSIADSARWLKGNLSQTMHQISTADFVQDIIRDTMSELVKQVDVVAEGLMTVEE